VSGGQLLGASGVIVDGSSYNVEFLDGTCINLYNGCDDVSDFTFQTEAAATTAAAALLDQVFLDGIDFFDSNPGLTNGCTVGPFSHCEIFTRFTPSDLVNPNIIAVINNGGTGPFSQDGATGVFAVAGFDTAVGGLVAGQVYAVWTPIPEPGTALLLGLGLLSLSARKRRQG
jgi:hypothetical protein